MEAATYAVCSVERRRGRAHAVVRDDAKNMVKAMERPRRHRFGFFTIMCYDFLRPNASLVLQSSLEIVFFFVIERCQETFFFFLSII